MLKQLLFPILILLPTSALAVEIQSPSRFGGGVNTVVVEDPSNPSGIILYRKYFGGDIIGGYAAVEVTEQTSNSSTAEGQFFDGQCVGRFLIRIWERTPESGVATVVWYYDGSQAGEQCLLVGETIEFREMRY